MRAGDLRVGERPRLTALLGAMCIAFSAIFVRFSGVSPTTVTTFRCLYAVPVLGLLAYAEDRRLGPRPRADRLVAHAAGLFFAADLTFFHYAIGAVGAGLATVLANVQVLAVGLVAWLVLGERPSTRTLAGLPVVLLGVVLISGLVGGGAYGRDPGIGAAFGLAASLSYAAFLLILRRGNRDRRRPAGPLFDATLSATAGGLVAGLVLRDLDPIPSWPAHGWLVLLALSAQVAGYLFISISLPRLPAVLTSIILLVQPAATLALGVVLLGERPAPLQLAGVGLVLGGLAIAAGGRSSGSSGSSGSSDA